MLYKYVLLVFIQTFFVRYICNEFFVDNDNIY